MANDRTEGERKRPAVVEEDRFIQAILADPDDTSIRLVYADWLEERGDPRGEFLRLEAALMELPREDERWAGMAARLRALRATIDRDWLTALGREPIERCELSFQFQCPKRWDHLRVTPNVDVRFCSRCKRHVHYCHSIEEARRQASRGRCVAVDPVVERKEGDLLRARRTVGILLGPPPPRPDPYRSVPRISVRPAADAPNHEQDQLHDLRVPDIPDDEEGRPHDSRDRPRRRRLPDLLEDEDNRPVRRKDRHRPRRRWQ
jgi:uncharacterized protein (TIGR02996 family)